MLIAIVTAKKTLTQRFIGFIEYPVTLCQNETGQFELFGWVIEAKWGVSSTFVSTVSTVFTVPTVPTAQCPQWPSNLEVQLPSMPKIESQIQKVELTPYMAKNTPYLAKNTQPKSSNCPVSF